jgi:hypothetical protein
MEGKPRLGGASLELEIYWVRVLGFAAPRFSQSPKPIWRTGIAAGQGRNLTPPRLPLYRGLPPGLSCGGTIFEFAATDFVAVGLPTDGYQPLPSELSSAIAMQKGDEGSPRPARCQPLASAGVGRLEWRVSPRRRPGRPVRQPPRVC